MRPLPRVFAVVGLFAIGNPGAAGGQRSSLAPPPQVIGFLQIPSFLGAEAESDATRRPAATVVLHREPHKESAIIARVTSLDMLDAADIDYRVTAAAVYGRAGRWSRLRLRGGQSGWISPEQSGAYHSFADEIEQHAADMYFTREWDRRLLTRPESEQTVPIPHDPRRRVIGYLIGTGPAVRVSAGAAGEEIRRQLHGSNPSGVVRAADKAEFLEFLAGAEVSVFAAPTLQSAVVGRVENHFPGDALETDGERVIAFSRRPGWFEVALLDHDAPGSWRKARRGWLQDNHEVWRFEPPSAVDSDGFAYPWADQEEHPIRVVGRREVHGRLWLHVQLLLDSECVRLLEDVSDPPSVVADGWTAAHDARGTPTVWWQTYCD